MNEIKITDFEGIRIGQTEDIIGGTGCTVIICDEGMKAGLDVRGGGPASRESELMNPRANAQIIHSIVLGGGSAFGLDAAGGVMRYLEENDIGFDVGVTKVPLVCQANLFDLTVGDYKSRPTNEMGYIAAKASEEGNYKDGNFGAGCGATVGKFAGMDRCMKSGIGSFAVQIGEFKLGAIVAVNALGDIFDSETGVQIAGLLNEEKTKLASTEELLYSKIERVDNKFTGNTTIGAIITNGDFNKTELGKIAAMAHNGYARSISPVNTSPDGDSIYAASTGKVLVDMDVTGTLAAKVMSKAITRAIFSAESAYGFPSYNEIIRGK